MTESLIRGKLTPSQAARAVGVSTSTICRWLRTGKLKGYRMAGSRLLIDPHDLAGVVKEVVPRG
jgi:excisionase family DNA binding protein